MSELIVWGVFIFLVLLLVTIIRSSGRKTAKRWDVFRDNNPEFAKKLEKELQGGDKQ